ncbi:MAG: outer membrane protein transport protein [Methylotenera sp.]|nr:outer membrane protein transport protein [Methylotenera sp.]
MSARRTVRTAMLALLIGLAGCAEAAGFALIEQSASGMGNALAGMGVGSDDPSSQYFNPATMAFMNQGTQLTLGGHVIAPTATLNNERAYNATTGFGHAVVSGHGGGNAGSLTFVPNLYVKTDFNDDVALGLGVTVPFGLSTEYRDGWAGRYHALASTVETINVNPAVSWKLNERFSIGGGVSVQYVKAKLTNAVDSGSTCLGLVARGLVAGASCAANGLLTPGNAATDSYVKLEAEDISFGFNLGVLFKPNQQTTLGLAYRSMIEQNVEGKAKFKKSAGLNAVLSGSANPLVNRQLANTDIQAQVDLPENISLSGAFQATPDLELLADVTWTNWSRFKELRIIFDNPVQADGVTTENWDDSWRYSIGANYQLNPSVTLRTGIAYDETVVADKQHRTPRIPDQNRTWLAFGTSWAMSPTNKLDVGYAHLFIKDVKLNNTTESSVKHNLSGEYNASVDILSMQLTHSF